ncbi:VOC family protein [Devosia pacifica]|uniref:VOC family protein n=1 Tax=Devosia pacifica TaxID=1335967 RepID=A0A918VNX7_9HYPH|nr:VOC family protein [Devosia pacifica]GHA12365.1 VOC family protein [Devosia pacifica]
MTSRLNPYINFRGQAREAMTFYHSVFGGQLNMNTFGEFEMAQQPDEADLIMHAQLDGENGMTLMGSDTPASIPLNPGSTISISLSGDDESALRGYWEKLSEGGNIAMPLEKAPWGDSFGMVRDRYGINWMVNIAGS